MTAGFPRNPSCPSGRPDHPPIRAGKSSKWVRSSSEDKDGIRSWTELSQCGSQVVVRLVRQMGNEFVEASLLCLVLIAHLVALVASLDVVHPPKTHVSNICTTDGLCNTPALVEDECALATRLLHQRAGADDGVAKARVP
eukprot:1182860-Prorocentrum_minimum.AAC.1